MRPRMRRIESLDGGLDYVRSVIVDDSLGICADLDAAMARHVASYRDEWADVLDDPDRLRRFASFVNTPPAPVARSSGDGWVGVCDLADLQPERGVAALLDGVQVALFRTFDGSLYALDNRDPFSGTYVLSRGIVGSRGETPTVASPMYKQVFDLRTGTCLDDDTVGVAAYPVRLAGERVEVRL